MTSPDLGAQYLEGRNKFKYPKVIRFYIIFAMVGPVFPDKTWKRTVNKIWTTEVLKNSNSKLDITVWQAHADLHIF